MLHVAKSHVGVALNILFEKHKSAEIGLRSKPKHGVIVNVAMKKKQLVLVPATARILSFKSEKVTIALFDGVRGLSCSG